MAVYGVVLLVCSVVRTVPVMARKPVDAQLPAQWAPSAPSAPRNGIATLLRLVGESA